MKLLKTTFLMPGGMAYFYNQGPTAFPQMTTAIDWSNWGVTERPAGDSRIITESHDYGNSHNYGNKHNDYGDYQDLFNSLQAQSEKPDSANYVIGTCFIQYAVIFSLFWVNTMNKTSPAHLVHIF